ncbi:MAG: hypothetical protein KME42_21855 [Tildeniella nuda ZEHNDER 1965/U140]|jgi:hypothetical protein|nr:hypothetical protein [Tildeniella nuda ZEHNDER 1965/U140]
MTNRLQAAIAAISQRSESEQDAIAALILDKISVMSQETEHQSIIASDQITGLFADEPELMEQVMQSIGHDREDDRLQSLGCQREAEGTRRTWN